MPENKKHKIVSKLESIFGETFNEIINKNFRTGDTRYDVRQKLINMIIERGLEERAKTLFKEDTTITSAIKPSSLYHAIKNEIEAGRLTGFDFITSNKGRKSTYSNKEYSLIFLCSNCNKKHKNENINNIITIGLKTYECPFCKTFGKISVTGLYRGFAFKKSLIKVFGNITIECFVNEKNEKIDNPFPHLEKEKPVSKKNETKKHEELVEE